MKRVLIGCLALLVLAGDVVPQAYLPHRRKAFRSAGGGGTLLTGLVAHLKLNEASGTRFDSHGSNDLNDVNSTSSTTGHIGNAARFIAASNQKLNITSPAASMQVGDFDWTFVLWANPDLAGDTQLLAWVGDISVRMNSARTLRVAATTTGGSTSFHSTTATLTVGVWNLIRVSFNATSNQILIRINNGTEQAFAQSSVRQSGGEFLIGRESGAGDNNKSVDSFSFFNRLLTSTEDDGMWNSGAGLDYENF